MNSPEDCVRKVIETKHPHDIRGRVASALHCLTDEGQRALACDFAEHVVSLTDSLERRCAYGRAIEASRGFITGQAMIEEVSEAYDLAFDASILQRSGDTYTSEDVWNVAVLAVLCCCQRDLETHGTLIRTKYRPDVIAVAEEACRVAARRAAEMDGNSDRLDDRTRQQVRIASDSEAAWQLGRILEDAVLHPDHVNIETH